MKARGFTLIELAVVVSILGILMALGAPSFMTWLRGLQVRNAAESLQNGLQYARMEALRRNARVSFWTISLSDPRVIDNSCARSAAGSSWVVSMDDPGGGCGAAISDTTAPRILQKKAAGDGQRDVSVAVTDASSAAASCVTFNGFGRVETTCLDASSSSPATRFQITPSTVDANVRTLEVRVTAGGLVRMCDPRVTSSSDPRLC